MTVHNQWRTTTLPNERLDILRRLYTLKDSEDVPYFLECHPSLVSLLEEASQKIQFYFPGSSVTLEMSEDPDDEEGALYLVASILTQLSPKEAFESMRRFRQDWWLDAAGLYREQLLITVGF
jgi:hypothetical protein